MRWKRWMGTGISGRKIDAVCTQLLESNEPASQVLCHNSWSLITSSQNFALVGNWMLPLSWLVFVTWWREDWILLNGPRTKTGRNDKPTWHNKPGLLEGNRILHQNHDSRISSQYDKTRHQVPSTVVRSSQPSGNSSSLSVSASISSISELWPKNKMRCF